MDKLTPLEHKVLDLHLLPIESTPEALAPKIYSVSAMAKKLGVEKQQILDALWSIKIKLKNHIREEENEEDEQ